VSSPGYNRLSGVPAGNNSQRRCIFVLVRTSRHRSCSVPLLLLFSYTIAAEEPQNTSETSPAAPALGEPERQVKDTDTAVVPNPCETSGTQRERQSFLRSFVADQKVIWTSPSRISRGDLKWLVPLAVGTGIAIGTDDYLSEQLPNPDDPPRIVGKHVSQLGALYTVAGISGGTYLIGHIAGKERLRETGWLGLEALAHTQIVVQGIKLATQRERPPEAKKRRGFWQGGSSFPSGHAANAWALATVAAREYREKKIVPIAVYSLATIVSAARLVATRHHASDILVGGVVGHLIGLYIHNSHRDPGLRARAVSLTPRVGLRYSRPARHYTLNLSWDF
jgi:membrane-associated phospholipid phosphatase